MKNDEVSAKTNSNKLDESADRIVLKRQEATKLDRWLIALNERYSGMVRFTKSDLANFFIRNHPEELRGAEMESLATELYDEVRWLNAALIKIRKAKKDGVTISLDDLVIKLKPALAAASPIKRTRSPRKRPEKSVNVDANQSDLTDSTEPREAASTEGN